MTPFLFFGHALLSVALLSGSRMSAGPRERVTRAVAALGIVMGLLTFLLRSTFDAWRGLEIEPDEAAIAGLAVACTWGLVMALDIGEDRWWAGALAGVGSTGLLAFAASQWTVPALLFLACGSAASYVALARSGRPPWVVIALSDAGIVAVLISDALARDGWAAPESIGSGLLVGLLAASALRCGVFPRIGPLGVLASPAAVMVPITTAIGFVAVSRWVVLPVPIPAAALLVIALGVAAWSVLRRSLTPAVVGAWPGALAGGLVLASESASVPAAIAGIFGVSLVALWPDALERGRLSRGIVLSSIAPTLAFGAIAITARGSFVRATGGGEPVELAAWIVISALLPVALATGVALGVFTARSEVRGGYHPEAVFMTWVLLGASVLTGVLLGTSRVFGALGGGPAALLFAAAGALGAAAAVRSRDHGVTESSPSAQVSLGEDLAVGRWAAVFAGALHVCALGAIGWITLQGLQTGFL